MSGLFSSRTRKGSLNKRGSSPVNPPKKSKDPDSPESNNTPSDTKLSNSPVLNPSFNLVFPPTGDLSSSRSHLKPSSSPRKGDIPRLEETLCSDVTPRNSGNMTGRGPLQTSQTNSPRVRTIRIYLPQGNQSFVRWDGSKTVGQVLKDVCAKRDIDMEGKVPCDSLSGKKLEMDQKLGDLEWVSEITFGTTLSTWAKEATNITVDRATSYEQNSTAARRLKVILPGNDSSIRAWQHDVSLQAALEAVMEVHGLTIENVFVKNDKTGEKLDWFKTLGEQDCDEVRIVNIAAIDRNRMMRIYFLEQGKQQQSSQVYVAQKTIQQVLDRLFALRPELNTKLKVFDSNGDIVALNQSCRSLPTQTLYYGEHPSQWAKRTAKTIVATPRQDYQPPEKSQSRYFTFYLPGGNSVIVPYTQKYLTKTLQQIISDDLALSAVSGPSTDIDGTVLDVSSRMLVIAEKVTNLKIAHGTNIKDWSRDCFIHRILPHKPLRYWENTNSTAQQQQETPLSFKVFLPEGQLSKMPYDGSKPLSEVFQRLASRPGFDQYQFVPTDMEGVELPMSMTLAEIPSRVVCYGPDILEWVLVKENRDKSQKKSKFSNSDRVRWVEAQISRLDIDDQNVVKTDEWVCVEEAPPHWYLQNVELQDEELVKNFKKCEPLYAWDNNQPFRFTQNEREVIPNVVPDPSPNVDEFEDSSEDSKGYSDWWTKREEQVLQHQKEFERVAIVDV